MKKKVLAIMLVAVSIMLISACGKKEKLYEIPDLSQYKTDYVGDSSNVINIVSGQEYPAGYSYDSIEIQSETEPYGLTVFLKDEPSAVKLEDELQVNADMTFDLIGNLGTIDYKTADSKEIIASYERFQCNKQKQGDHGAASLETELFTDDRKDKVCLGLQNVVSVFYGTDLICFIPFSVELSRTDGRYGVKLLVCFLIFVFIRI